MKESCLKKNFQKFKSLSINALLGCSLIISAETAAQAKPSYYTGLTQVTPIARGAEEVLLINFGKKVAMVTDRPERTHKLVSPEEMVKYINSSDETTAVVLRPYKDAHLNKFELVPAGRLVATPDGVEIDTGNYLPKSNQDHKETKHHKQSKSSHKKHHTPHHALWSKVAGEHFDGLMTATLLMYKGEGEKDFFITPKEMEFSSSTEEKVHINLKFIEPVVESLGIKKKGCKEVNDTKGKKFTPKACVDSQHMSIHHFEKLWASKAKDSFGKDNPNAFLWATFKDKETERSVVMTVVIGSPKEGHLPLTILDAHVVSDEGTQRMGQEITPDEIVKILLNGKKAKGVMMVDGSNCAPGCSCAGQLACPCCGGF